MANPESTDADRQQQAVIERLVTWAQERVDVRALILTSTRAIPGGHVDAYSDYDVIAIVDDVEALVNDQRWLDTFGEVLIAYWDPVEADAASGAVNVGNITNYVDGLKIDFSLWNTEHYRALTAGAAPDPELDAGHHVLLDKENLTADLPAPTYRSYIPQRPDEASYRRLITDFLIGVPYVAKGLLRDELLPTKWVLDFDMRFNYLVPMLEWRVQCDHDWSLKGGNLGKGLKKQVPASVWDAMEGTFTGADPEANWTALFAMIDLFAMIAGEVADQLGYDYPDKLVTGVADHARKMRSGDFA